MKMRLLYILYCPPTPATWRQGPFNPFAILHMPIYRSPPPSCLPIGWRTGPSRSHVFGCRGERGETGITPPHAGWQRAQKIPCISHVDASHGEWSRIESSLLFCNFFMSKSLRKAYFLRVKLGSLERKLPRLGIDIFLNFWHLRHFRAISLRKKQGPFHPWSFWSGLIHTCMCIRMLGNITNCNLNCVSPNPGTSLLCV